MIILILAGGEGSRVWPLSRNEFPKQFLHFGKQYSLLQKTILRFRSYAFVKRIVISTNELYKDLVKKQIFDIDSEECCEILLEPLRKNTAPAIAYSIRYLEELGQIDGKDQILVVPSDHFIEPEADFREALQQLKTAAGSKVIIFGVTAKKPETGYGYIKRGSQLGDSMYEIETFTEKPTFELACHYVNSGNYFWNCGIFLFSTDVFWQQMKMHAPEIYVIANQSLKDMRENYKNFPNISIDYALMEKTRESVLLPLTMDWFDIGSWDSMYEFLEKDSDENAIVGELEKCDVKGSLVFNQSSKTVMAIGIDDLIVVNTEDSLLIVKKGCSQKIKNLLKKR